MKFQEKFLILLGLSLFLFTSLKVSASEYPYQDFFQKKTSGSLTTDFFFQFSKDVYGPNGSLAAATPTEKHYDAGIEIKGRYALTDALALWLLFPILYRNETSLYTASDWGLGDIEAGVQYQLFESTNSNFEFGLELAGKFPSGDTDLGTGANQAANTTDLPLGSGNSDIELGLILQEDLSPNWVLRQRAAYRFRFDAVAEYLRTNSINQLDSQGNTRALPTGNLTMDWGDEIHLDADIAWKPSPKLAFRVGGLFLYRFQTEVQNIVAQVDASGSVVFDRAKLIGNSGYQFEGKAEAFFRFSENLFLRAAAFIPILGESFPTLSIAESLIGERYELGVGYDF